MKVTQFKPNAWIVERLDSELYAGYPKYVNYDLVVHFDGRWFMPVVEAFTLAELIVVYQKLNPHSFDFHYNEINKFYVYHTLGIEIARSE